MAQWYPQTIPELQKLAEDDAGRSAMQARMTELKSVNQRGLRCQMSKDLEIKLEAVLHG